jgi:RNA polymerase sigma-70 factor (ECF subfamily)
MALQVTTMQSTKSVGSYKAMSDADLIVCCQTGRDDAAFKELVKRHEKMISALLFRYAPDWQDRSDLMQEVLIRLWRGIRNLRKPVAFKSWLNQIVANLFYDEVKKRSRRIASLSLDQTLEGEEGPVRDIEDPKARTDEEYLRKEAEDQLRNGLALLPSQFRTAVSLRATGLSYEEIAIQTKTDLGTVKSRISRARTKLQVILTPYFDDDKSIAA